MKCKWCLKRELKNPEWEQEDLDGNWKPLCKPCAEKRLRNPYNALLNLRKITPNQ